MALAPRRSRVRRGAGAAEVPARSRPSTRRPRRPAPPSGVRRRARPRSSRRASEKLKASGFFDATAPASSASPTRRATSASTARRTLLVQRHHAHRRRHRLGLGRDASGGSARSDAPALAARAPQQGARLARKPRALEPGDYTVILEPAAVADLIGLRLHRRALGARRRRGAQLLLEAGRRQPHRREAVRRVGHADAPTRRSARPGAPWGGGGGVAAVAAAVRRRRRDRGCRRGATTWIEKGVLKALCVDRYWARKTEREPLPYAAAAWSWRAATGTRRDADRPHRARPAGDPLLVHPRGQPADASSSPA